MRGNVSEIYKVYDSPNRELVIPVYQRNYDWGKPQCAQLVEDLVELVKSDREKHFFGSIVGDQEDAWKWVVIDGQQRLTTVSILILALSHLSDAGAIPTHDSDLGPRLRQSYLLKDENSKDPKFRLKPVKDDNVAYQRLFGEEEHFIESSNITRTTATSCNSCPRRSYRPMKFGRLFAALKLCGSILNETTTHNEFSKA